MKIVLSSGSSYTGGNPLITCEDGRDILIQTDWEYPSVAQAFGWDMQSTQTAFMNDCDHPETDGTVNCSCGVSASEFIQSARAWIDDNDGAEAEDPGYFSE